MSRYAYVGWFYACGPHRRRVRRTFPSQRGLTSKEIFAPGKEIGMKRTIFVYALLAGTAAVLAAQQASQPNPYEGTSNPPPDTRSPRPRQSPRPKPSHLPAITRPRSLPAQAQPAQRSLDGSLYTVPQRWLRQRCPPATSREHMQPKADGTDDGIVQVAPDHSAAPALNQRAKRTIPMATSCIRRRCLRANSARAPSFAFAC